MKVNTKERKNDLTVTCTSKMSQSIVYDGCECLLFVNMLLHKWKKVTTDLTNYNKKKKYHKKKTQCL